MNYSYKSLAALFLFVPLMGMAGAGQNPVDITNSLRIEHDDNVFSTGEGAEQGEVDSLKIIEQIEFLFDVERGPTYYGLAYSPSFVWYEDRPSDDTDFNHQLDASIVHRFNKTSTLTVKDTLRRSEEPELIGDDDVQIRKNNDFFYNSLNASYSTEVVPKQWTVRVDGRYVTLRYDEDDVADFADYDQFSAGIDLENQVGPNTVAAAEIRATTLDYDTDFRDSDSFQIGGNVSQVFSPALQGELRAGYEYRDLNDAFEEESNSPFVDGSLVYYAGRDTQLTLGAAYALEKSPINTFAQQTRLRLYGVANYALSPALSLNLSGSVSEGDFDSDDATSAFDPEVDPVGDESVVQFTIGLSYRLNVRNSLKATYQYTDLDSDVRPGSDFDRTRFSLGWQYNL